MARIHKDPNGQRHLAFVNQVIKHNRHAHIAVFLEIRVPVLKHHHARRLLRPILRRHIHGVFAPRALEDLALKDVRRHLAARHAFLPFGILCVLILGNFRLRLFLILKVRRGENPFRGFGKNGAPMPPAVAVIAPNHLVLVALVLQGGRHLRVRERPMPVQIIQIAPTFLQ